ncbi:hypothetical protein A2159_01855 [Candidatus Woesebacteria bacterium RBG_13_34_9]|uniref:Uncharacterized protein n=1 Tax=Candidatus Woesebacteria bacterium RBG_13_34_9 TaxID=1802477 RepID=A0A1F7X6U7_9BACT|nr:MAG: hypothetical protein A2159_01855 [Candidatus Woesebacteria bacterium RBG_13_34_9]
MEEEKSLQSEEAQDIKETGEPKNQGNKSSRIFGFLFVIALILILSAIIYFYWLNKVSFKYSEITTTSPQETLTPSPATELSPSASEEESTVPSGWETYKNEDSGFEISYPSTYKALTDKVNLSGWPNAAVLIYSGGQSYDLPIEVWSTKAEYEAKYKNATNLVVKEVNDKFITLMNANYKEEVDEIIKTFRAL